MRDRNLGTGRALDLLSILAPKEQVMQVTARLFVAVLMWAAAIVMMVLGETTPGFLMPWGLFIAIAALVPSGAAIVEHERIRTERLVDAVARAAVEVVAQERTLHLAPPWPTDGHR